MTLKPPGLGPDPLDIALEKMDGFSPYLFSLDYVSDHHAPLFAATLLAAGAPVERSHSRQLWLIKQSNPPAFEFLRNILQSVGMDIQNAPGN